MASSLASASSKSNTTAFKYDVYLALRDPKGRVKSYVVNQLRDAGITAFVDEEEGFSVYGAITVSRIVMVLFTPEFLESEMCLKKLVVRIMWWADVLPVFCGVSRQQVHEKMVALSKRFDFAGICFLPGLKLSVKYSGNKISSRLANFGLSMLHNELFHDLPRHQVGLARRVRELLKTLGWRYILSDDTIIIGIWGDGGIGKTTIAKAIYDRIGGNFEGKSFLANIQDVWNEDNGEVLLKKQLISDISETELDETNVDVMHQQMKQVLCGRRVLVVLDNVNSEFQLKKLRGNVKWCGKGSLIFITARHNDIFDGSVDISYEMKRLNSKRSLKLFCLHAFKKFTPTDDFRYFFERVMEYCEGLPLLLEVIGSLLHNRTKKEWQTIMNNMVGIPRGLIQEKLKISCDLLTDREKDLFFNIASFYVGQSKHYVTQLLKTSKFPMEMGVSTIIERNLVKVMNDKLYVHDLLQEIGREISPSKPKNKYSYDVFLSFRGDDTRKSFTSHLCAALKQAGIEVYMDEEKIERGESISSALLEAIESSRISIIIFSKNYAGSSWCLQELEKIMECYNTTDQEVLPFFFYVRPFEVRKQQNVFGKAWERLINRTSSNKMKKLIINLKGALKEVANLSGWDMHNYRAHQIPNDQIHEKLKISYDGLSDDIEKEIFVDICCFFVGKDKSYVTQILNGCGLHADIGINRLIERSLVRVGNKNRLEMHDLLRNMGREIIREQSPEKPEKRTRLWFYDDVLDVLRNKTGTISIKGMSLNMSRNNSLYLSAKMFKKMKRLRLLQLDNVQLAGDYGYLSANLRWLCWHGFPLESMPMNFNLEKIVAIDLKWSNLVEVWEKSQLLEGLKSLNLSHSHYLTETPDFSKIPYLEKLILKDCPCLSKIHPSIGDLKYIVLLNLKDCKGLKHLPRSVYNLKSLKTLNLCGCSKFDKLEEDIGQMESLTTLVANQTAMAQVPFSLVRLKSIKYVSLCGYEGLPRDVFPSLVLSWMSPSHRSKSLSRAFQILPSLIRGLSHPLFSRRNEISEARPSTSQASCQNTPALLEFHEQVHQEKSVTLMSSLTIQVGRFNKTMDIFLKSVSKGWNGGGVLDFSLPMENHPDWLVFVNEGSSLSFKVPQVVGRCLKGVVLYIIYSSLQDSFASVHSVGIMIKNFTKATMDFYELEVAATSTDEEGQNIVSNLGPGNEVEVEIKFARKYIVKKTAIYLVYAEETDWLITSK